jgi:hypothetical protein
MRLGINLRSDLARLSDAELATQLDRLEDYYNSRFGSFPVVGSLKGQLFYGPEWLFGRGPIHARTAYKIQIAYHWIFRGPRGTQYLVECDLKDLRDERRRRAAERETSPWMIR